MGNGVVLTKSKSVTIFVPFDLLKLIEDYQIETRVIGNRSKAIVELLRTHPALKKQRDAKK
jgi:hypothetical protein